MMTELVTHTLSGNNLVLRPGEHLGYCTYVKWVESGQPGRPYVYAVMLLPTPALPGKAHPETKQLKVLCAQRYACLEGECAGEALWGWVALDRDATEHIGRDLESIGATHGAWYVIQITLPDSGNYGG
jgi:hypothetical protein